MNVLRRPVLVRAAISALVLGAVGLAAGYFGPLILKPNANQGPLTGIFLTGPAALLIGLIFGAMSGARGTPGRQFAVSLGELTIIIVGVALLFSIT